MARNGSEQTIQNDTGGGGGGDKWDNDGQGC